MLQLFLNGILQFPSEQPVIQVIRHDVEVTIREKKSINKPVKIAPITLVAAKVIAKRIIERSTAPSIPASKTGKMVHRHLLKPVLRRKIEEIRRTAR